MRLLGALVGVALLTTRGLSGFYAEAGLIPLDDPRFAESLLRGLQVDSFQKTFLVTAAVCFATLLPALAAGAQARSVSCRCLRAASLTDMIPSDG